MVAIIIMLTFLARRALRPSTALRARALCAAATPPPQKLIEAEDMSHALRRRVASLESMHAQFENLEEEHFERLKQIEVSYQEQTHALFQRRAQIISGEIEPTEEEVLSSAYFAEFQEQGETAAAGDAEENEVGGVPAFWPTALRSCVSLNHIPGFEVSEADWAVLDYLTDVSSRPWEGDVDAVPEGWDVSTGEPGFSLHFSFAPNPFLESRELVLYCNGDGEVERADEPVWTHEQHGVRHTARKKEREAGPRARTPLDRAWPGLTPAAACAASQTRRSR